MLSKVNTTFYSKSITKENFKNILVTYIFYSKEEKNHWENEMKEVDIVVSSTLADRD